MMSRQKIIGRQLTLLTSEELVVRLNQEVRNAGWTSTRAIYLQELRNALINAGLDITEVVNESGGLILSREVELRHKKIHRR